MLQNFPIIKFSQKRTDKAARTSRTTPGPPEPLPGLPLPGGWGQLGPKYVFDHFSIGVTHLPSFNSIGPMTTAADLPLALGRAAGPLGEVLDLL